MLLSEFTAAADAAFDRDDTLYVCVFCDVPMGNIVCPECGDYKGAVSVEEWEAQTGEKWEA